MIIPITSKQSITGAIQKRDQPEGTTDGRSVGGLFQAWPLPIPEFERNAFHNSGSVKVSIFSRLIVVSRSRSAPALESGRPFRCRIPFSLFTHYSVLPLCCDALPSFLFSRSPERAEPQSGMQKTQSVPKT